MNARELIGGALHGGLSASLLGGAAGGALVSLLSGKGAKKVASTALAAGGIAMVGGLAWTAYQRYAEQRGAAARGAPPDGLPAPAAEPAEFEVRDRHALLIVRAMVTAAGADGHIDAAERERVLEKVAQLGLSAAERSVIFEEMRAPSPIEALAREVQTLGLASDVYLASALVVDPEETHARWHLRRLAERLDLPAPLVEELNRSAWGQVPATPPPGQAAPHADRPSAP